ncbi:MAG: caspase family protein [Cyanobacteria bacterium J06555_12]
MTASRREFLIKSAVGLTGFALSPALESVARRLQGQSASYGQAIAATTGRKYACLIGIDRYSNGLEPLQGCTTDVSLQQEVLEHRFGFSDIVTLTDLDATREAIEQALIDTLLERVTSSDTVVIHFSGYGHTLPDGTPLLLSANSNLPTNTGEIDALPLETLYQVVQALPTKRVSVVLDCGFTAGGSLEEGNWRLRSPVIPAAKDETEATTYELTPAILERQIALNETYRSAPKPGSFSPNQIAQAKGNWLLAASPGDSAAEGLWDGFSAGLFTYLLTQSLWDSTSRDSWKQVIQLTSAKVDRTVARDDKPILQGKGNSNGLYSQSPTVPHGISGAISQVQALQAEIWLGGVSPTVLPFLDAGTRFRSCASSPDSGHQEWVLRSRDKLTAQVDLATPSTPTESSDSQSPQASATSLAASNSKPMTRRSQPAEVGTFVKEIERVVPVARLAIALDTSLERIEKVDVTSALSSASLAGEMRAIETAQLHERSVDCLIGCMTPELQTQLAIDNQPAVDHLPEIGSYGLMWSGRAPMIDTFGSAGEAPKSAVKRLLPRLQHLLAAKRLRTTINRQSSDIPVVLEVSGSDTVWQEGTAGAIARTPLVRKLRKGLVGLPELTVGSSLTYAIDNRGDVPLHVLLLAFDRLGGLSALANGSGVGANDMAAGDVGTFIIPPRRKVDLAQPLGLNLAVRSPKGLTEVLAIASTDPLANSGTMLQEIAKDMGVSSGFVTLPRPLDLTQAIVTELTMAGPTEDTRLLKHNNHATLSLAYTVV